MDIDQQKHIKAMHEAKSACNSVYRVRSYFEWLANEVCDNPVRRERVEGWRATAAYAENIVNDAMKMLSHAYDVMLKWEREDEDKKYWDKREV